MAAPDYSKANLDRFLQMAAEKGLMNRGTAKALRVAAMKVLSVLDDHDLVDLRELDREAAFRRFQNLNGMNYSPESLNTYRSRFTTAIDGFTSYVENPSGYRPSAGKPAANGQKKPAASKRPSGAKSATRKVAQDTPNLEAIGRLQPTNPAESLMIPIPIRDGLLVRVFGIPTDLSQEEAKKIAAVIQAYAAA